MFTWDVEVLGITASYGDLERGTRSVNRVRTCRWKRLALAESVQLFAEPFFLLYLQPCIVVEPRCMLCKIKVYKYDGSGVEHRLVR